MEFHRDVTGEYFKQLVGQLKPWGVPVFVCDRRDNMRHLETRSKKGFYMGPGSSPSMDRVFLKDGGTGALKQFLHVLVPPAFAQQHAMRMHLAAELYPPLTMSNAQMRRLAKRFMLKCVMWGSMMHTQMSLTWRSSQDWTCSLHPGSTGGSDG